ncbi:hypothetical protein PsYK624_105620 [Phanerochaete sordida]|uniref:Uncharacterized protein n=1 Tax=Phanerochaete sordida TaxID=48140 RepID=A0A9P3LGZ7_9APHY|nr:hypothetical protein PsYK624_105620 [Phanerochaete sordida]
MPTPAVPTSPPADAPAPPKCRRLLGLINTADKGLCLFICGDAPPPALLAPHCAVFHPARKLPSNAVLRRARAFEATPEQWAELLECVRQDPRARWTQGERWGAAQEAAFQRARAAALEALAAPEAQATDRVLAGLPELVLPADAELPETVLPSFAMLFEGMPDVMPSTLPLPVAPPVPLQTPFGNAPPPATCVHFGFTQCLFPECPTGRGLEEGEIV